MCTRGRHGMTALKDARLRAASGGAHASRRWNGAGTHSRVLAGSLLGADLVTIGVAALVAGLLRDRLTLFRPTLDVRENVTGAALILVSVWLLALLIGGAYRPRRMGVGTNEYTTVLVWSLIAAGTTGMALYLVSYDLSRGFFVLLFALGIPLLLTERYTVRRVIHALRARGHLQTRLLVAGSGPHIARVAAVLRRERWLGYCPVGALPTDEDPPDDLPVVGSPDDVLEAVRATGAHGVLFAEGSFAKAGDFNEMARQLKDHQAQMIVVPTLTDIAAERIDVRPVAGMPLVFVDTPRALQAGSWGKRIFDLVGSSVAIVLASPLMLAIALAIRIEDGAPVLFRQRRTGLKGQEFDCFKFRSMVVDAEARLRELEARNEAAGVLFKLRDDPRITKVGRLLRRFSLDELPQLLNVWTGRMSLVGPRPALPAEVARYQQHVLRRLDVRPGMTGLWQVSGRSELSWDDTVRYDLYYVDNWSMLQDLAILARTLGAVMRGRGAY